LIDKLNSPLHETRWYKIKAIYIYIYIYDDDDEKQSR